MGLMTRDPRLTPNPLSDLKLDPEFYITRHFIPALNRVFNLIGIDVGVWYDQMPKRYLAFAQYQNALEGYRGETGVRIAGRNGTKEMGKTLDMHFTSLHCLVCGAKTDKKGGYRVVVVVVVARPRTK